MESFEQRKVFPTTTTPPPTYSSQPSFTAPAQDDFTTKADNTWQPNPEKPNARRAILAECSENVAIPGVPNLFKAHNIPLKAFWLVANIVCWGVFGLVMYTLFMKFSDYPTVVNADIEMGSNLDFPAVTICNLNRVQAQRISPKSKFYGLTKLYRQVMMDIKMQSNEKFEGFSFRVNPDDCYTSGPEASEYHCEDWTNCIEVQRVCDGIDDCNDKSDETGCPTMSPGDMNSSTTTAAPMQETKDMKGIANADMYSKVNWSNPDWYEVYQMSKTDDYRDIYPFTYMNQTEVEHWSNAASDFVVTCSFDQNDCDVTRDMFQFLDERYGRCVTFNSPMTDRTDSMLSTFSNADNTGGKTSSGTGKGNSTSGKPKTIKFENTARTGILYGLKASLWMDVNEYLSLLSPAVGAIISVHNPNVEPDLQSSAIVVQPGQFAQIGVKRVTISRLPEPYSKCVDDFPEGLPIPEKKQGMYKYNQQICTKYCHQKLIYDSCGCYESFMTGAQVLCQHHNATVTACVFDVYEQISSGQLACDQCPMACLDDFFQTSVTTSTWPLLNYVPFFIDYMWKTVEEDAPLRRWLDTIIEQNNMEFDMIADEMKAEMARVSVHYETMSYETIDFYASYTLVQFIADIGGYMGLFVGVCAMTLFEVIDWALQLSFCTGRLS